MKREFYKYLVVFTLSLSLAFWASIPKSTKDRGKISVRSVNLASIERVEFVSADAKNLYQKNENQKWWVESTRGQVKEEFLASNKLQDIFVQWNPLEAIRVIDGVKLDDEKAMQEYGLKDSAKSLIVKGAKDQVLMNLQIGKQAYGSRNLFVVDLMDKKLMLLAGEFINELEHPETKIYERTITQVVFDEIQSATVEAGKKVRKFNHTKRDEKQLLMWTAEGDDKKANLSAKSWFERLDRVRIVSFATKEEASMVASLQPLFSAELESSNAKDKLVFVKAPSKAAASGNSSEYFAKSNFLGVWAKVASTRLEPIEKDLPSLLGD